MSYEYSQYMYQFHGEIKILCGYPILSGARKYLKESENKNEYRIRSSYRTYPYKHTVKKFCSLQITTSAHFLYFFTKAYVGVLI